MYLGTRMSARAVLPAHTPHVARKAVEPAVAPMPSASSQSAESTLYKKQRQAAKRLKDLGKLVAKAAKKVSKAEASEYSVRLRELADAMAALNEGRFEVEDLFCRKRAIGFAESSGTCSSSSSSCSSSSDCGGQPEPRQEVLSAAEGVPTVLTATSGDVQPEQRAKAKVKKPRPEVRPAAEGLPAVLAATRGEVAVCEGKACCRKGGSDEIYEELVQHFQTRDGVRLGRCKCLGQCKYATSVRLELEREVGVPLVVTGIELQTVQGITRPALSAAVA